MQSTVGGKASQADQHMLTCSFCTVLCVVKWSKCITKSGMKWHSKMAPFAPTCHHLTCRYGQSLCGVISQFDSNIACIQGPSTRRP